MERTGRQNKAGTGWWGEWLKLSSTSIGDPLLIVTLDGSDLQVRTELVRYVTQFLLERKEMRVVLVHSYRLNELFS